MKGKAIDVRYDMGMIKGEELTYDFLIENFQKYETENFASQTEETDKLKRTI